MRPLFSASGGIVLSAAPIPRDISRVNLTPQGGGACGSAWVASLSPGGQPGGVLDSHEGYAAFVIQPIHNIR
jgi:hypothetical protein